MMASHSEKDMQQIVAGVSARIRCPSLLALAPIASRQVVNKPANTPRCRADRRSFLATRHRADECPSAGASANDQGILFPRPPLRMRRIGSRLHDRGRSSDIVPIRPFADVDRMETVA